MSTTAALMAERSRIVAARSSSARRSKPRSFHNRLRSSTSPSTAGDLQAQWATNLNTILASWTNRNGGALGIEIKTRTN